MSMKLIPLFALCSAVILAGCSNLSNQTRYQFDPLPAPEYKPGELNRESLYQLLQAEIAGQRGMFPQALKGYMHQSKLTGDAGVAERATHIAQYLRQPGPIQQAAKLWIKADPDNAEPYQISASILLFQGKFDEALPLLEQALKNNQPQTLALIDSRVAQMPPAAVNAYQQLISTQLLATPESAELHRSNGVLLRRQGKFSEALAAFDRSEKLAPEQLDTLVQKADLLRTTNQTLAALAVVKKGLKEAPDNRQLKLISIQLLFDSQQTDAATRAALAMIEENPRDPQLHLYLSLLMLDAERTEPASQVLTELLKTNPKDSTPSFYLGHVAEKHDQPDAALKHYLNVSNGPKLFPAFSQISSLLDSAEQQQRLQQILLDGRSRYPHIALQLYVLEAEWLHLYDLTDSALAVLEGALQEYPDETHLLYTRAMLVETSDFPQAEQDLRKILASEPDNALALNALGYLMSLYTERYEEALALVSKALSLKPDDAATQDSMGWILFRLNRADEAVVFLEQAHEQLPEPEVAGHLVEVYYALGQPERAQALLKQSLEMNPDSSFLQDVAEKLGL